MGQRPMVPIVATETQYPDRRHRDPVSRNVSGQREDEVAHRGVVEVPVDVLLRRESNGVKNGGIVESQAPKSDVVKKPGAGSPHQYFSVLPFSEMLEEGFWCRLRACASTSQFRRDHVFGVNMALSLPMEIGLHVSTSLFLVKRHL